MQKNKVQFLNSYSCIVCLDEAVGICVLLPHISSILSYIEGTIDTLRVNSYSCLIYLDEAVGIRVLLPHISSILSYIEGTIDTLRVRLSKKMNSCKELQILSR